MAKKYPNQLLKHVQFCFVYKLFTKSYRFKSKSRTLQNFKRYIAFVIFLHVVCNVLNNINIISEFCIIVNFLD
jgi:hypothetical protein